MNSLKQKQSRFDVTPLARSMILLGVFAGVAGCGGSSVSGTPVDPGDNTEIPDSTVDPDGGSGTGPDTTVYPDAGGGEQTGPDEALLAADAGTVLRGSMLGYYTDISNQNGFGGGIFPVAIADSADGAADSSTESSAQVSTSEVDRFSDTNVQEAGVDESDRVKVDGNILFSLEKLEVVEEVPDVLPVDSVTSDIAFYNPGETLSAYRLDGDNSAVLSRTTLANDGRTPEGMYLHKNGSNRQLVMLSKGGFDNWGLWYDDRAWSGLKTRITWYNANDPATIQESRTMELDGQLVSSRKIGNRLILVTRYTPTPPGLIPYPFSAEDVQTNRDVINNAEIGSLMPGYSEETGSTSIVKESVVPGNQCYYAFADNAQSDTQNTDTGADELSISPIYPSPTVISIVSIDLNSAASETAQTSVSATCFIGESETIYVSTESLYLATTQYEYSFATDTIGRPFIADYDPGVSTDIHKFSIESATPAFRGSTSVRGHLGWYPERKPYRMSEKDGNLRVVTFGDESRTGSPVVLSVLAEQGSGKLKTVATLPNENRPEPIGKKGENLYASRFIGDRGYLVTFRITDPLYVLDIANPSDPFIAGELELPGYSDYLHPVNDNLLLGLGKDAIAASGTGWGDGRGAFYQGVKLALFDVTDPSNLSVADSRIIGKRGTDSPALSQPHSFAWLPGTGDRNPRMAIPLQLNDGQQYSNQPNAWAEWTSNNLLTMEVNAASKVFEDVPNWTFESAGGGYTYNPVSLYDDRAIIGTAGDLYAIHNGSLYYGQWGAASPTSVAQQVE